MSQRLAERPEHHDSNSSFTAVGRKRAGTPGLRKKHWGERFLGATSLSPSAEIAAKTSFRNVSILRPYVCSSKFVCLAP